MFLNYFFSTKEINKLKKNNNIKEIDTDLNNINFLRDIVIDSSQNIVYLIYLVYLNQLKIYYILFIQLRINQ